MASRIFKRGSLPRLILEKIGDLGVASVSAFFPARYPEARIWRKLLGLDSGYQFKHSIFSVQLSRLRAEGLIVRSGDRRRGAWRLTARGTAALAGNLPAADGIERLVIFDIPERERKKRDTIRLELAAAGYTQLQRSVWIGARPLPQGFAELIQTLRLQPHVHMFSVRSRGTLGDRRSDSRGG